MIATPVSNGQGHNNYINPYCHNPHKHYGTTFYLPSIIFSSIFLFFKILIGLKNPFGIIRYSVNHRDFLLLIIGMLIVFPFSQSIKMRSPSNAVFNKFQPGLKSTSYTVVISKSFPSPYLSSLTHCPLTEVS